MDEMFLPQLMDRGRSGVEAGKECRDRCGSFLALDLKAGVYLQVQASAFHLLNIADGSVHANLGADRHRCGEAHLLQAVVELGSDIFDVEELAPEGDDQ